MYPLLRLHLNSFLNNPSYISLVLILLQNSMLIWLLLCLFGVITALGFGQIANAAHVSGLLIGCLSGGIFAIVARRRAA